MEPIDHDMCALFAQLGLPSEPEAVRDFIRRHRHLASGVRLHEANMRFHRGIAAAAGSNVLSGIVSTITHMYDREQSAGRLATVWEEIAPPSFKNRSRAGGVRRGVLEVVVSHSALVQEMGFHKEEVLRRLGEAVPAEGIADIKCRVGDVS